MHTPLDILAYILGSEYRGGMTLRRRVEKESAPHDDRVREGSLSCGAHYTYSLLGEIY